MSEIKWREHFTQKIDVEDYYISIKTQHDSLAYVVRYVKHNGFTLLESSIAWPFQELTQDAKDFNEWLKFRSEFNTRYDRPHRYKPIRFNRKKKLVTWGVNTFQDAYNQWYKEKINENQ